MSIFLEKSDVAILTGKKLKSQQVDALRRMGILFYVNASGRPVVPKSAVEGKETSDKPTPSWEPSILNSHG